MDGEIGVVLVAGPLDVDVAEALALVELDDALLEQLEEGEEADDHLHPVGEPGGQPAERQPAHTRQFGEQLGDRVADAGGDRGDVEQVDVRLRLGGRGAQERGVELPWAHAFEGVGQQPGVALVGAGDAGVAAVGVVGEVRQHPGNVLERLAFEEAGEQQVALLPQRQFLVEVDVVAPGKEAPCLQFDQGRGDEQELGGDLQVEVVHQPQLGQVGVDDGAQRHLVDVDLFAQDQVQQQVERALEHGGGDRIGHPVNATCWVACRAVTRVLSCIQPTGEVHLGNYLGALRNWVAGQHTHDAFHGIVDLHALTVTDRPGVIGETTVELAAMLFAIGLDPDVATVFVQSHVPEHTQLAWVMECTLSYGELSRMTQFKEKSAQHDFVSAGLFTYPALQAADILLYDAEEVPVGDDQRQHIEITRDAAIRFNHRFGDTLVVPKAVTPPAGARVMDLQNPTSKMSKSSSSDTGIVSMLDPTDAVLRKFKRAVTDSDGEVRYDREAKPGVSNLLDILAAATGSTTEATAARYQQYGPLKADAGEAVVELLRPIQARYRELLDDRGQLAALLHQGAGKARAVACGDAAAGVRSDRVARSLDPSAVGQLSTRTSSARVTTRRATLCGGWQAIRVIDCSIEPL